MRVASLAADLWRLGGRGALIGAVMYALGVLGGALVTPPQWASTLVRGELACTIRVGPSGECGVAGIHRTWESNGVPAKLPSWSRERTRLADECGQSVRRQCALLRALDDDANEAFPEGRQRLDEERATFAGLAAREKSIRFAERDTASFIELGIVDLLTTLLALALLIVTARPVRPIDLNRVAALRRGPALGFVAVGSAAAIASLYLGGVANKDKLWLGLDSYLVSPPSWWCNLAAMLGVVVMFAQPMALLWSMSDGRFIPEVKEIKPLSSTGDCNVGGYVAFLHAWTMIAFALSLAPAILFTRKFAYAEQASFRDYLIPVFVGLVLTAVLVGRLVINAIRLRARYQEAVASLGETWTVIQDLRPAPDPTIPFIGENWWKLPATFASLLIAFWTILEWTGVARTLADAMSK